MYAGSAPSSSWFSRGIGRARQRRHPRDDSAQRGAQLLEDVVSFLGVRRRGGDATTTADRRELAPVRGGGREPC
jgi:hypothetical protein